MRRRATIGALLLITVGVVLGAAPAARFAHSRPALRLKPCFLQGIAARCGMLAVPEDRRIANGHRIRLYVGVVRAKGPRPHAAPIFWLAGGPGQAAASELALFAVTQFAPANRKRDIVLVDQRGVGKSAPLLCPVPRVLPGTDEAVRAYGQACLRRVRRDPRLYTTDAAMDDLNTVRRALGYRRIVLYGESYGTSAAQVYLARHGASVAAAVLDGATLLDVPIWERMPLSTQGAFDALASRCSNDRACHATFPDVGADLRTVLEQLRASPLQVPIGGTNVPYGAAEAQDTVRNLLRDPSSAARVPLILHRAATGYPSELVTAWAEEVVPGGIEFSRRLIYWSIRCAEGWSRDDPAEITRLGADTEFLEAALAEAHLQALVCSLLGEPLPAPDTAVVPKSRVPVLFVVGGMDPQDPLENVASAPQSFPNAQILVVPGGGHVSVQLACLPLVAMRFFTSHRLTATDRACAASVRPPPFITS